MSKEQTVWSLIGAFVVPAFNFLYGEGDAVVTGMGALLFFVIMDWISGIRAANKDNSYASRYGIDGIFRTFFMLLLPASGSFLDKYFGLPGLVFGIFVAGMLYHVIKSMIANTIRAGWGDYLPVWVFDKLIAWVRSEIDSKIKRSIDRGGNEDEEVK